MKKYKGYLGKTVIFTGIISLALASCGSPNKVPVVKQETETMLENSDTSKKNGDSDVNDFATEKIESEVSKESENMESEMPKETEYELTDTQRNSMNMLNYLTVLTQEINSSKNSKLYLEEAYSSIVTNTLPEAVDDRTLGELGVLLDTLENYRMAAVKRERLEYIYEQNKAQAIRDAVPNPLGLLSSVQSSSLSSIVMSVSYMAIDSITSYQTSSAQADLEYLQDGWALDDEESEILHNQRSDMFEYMVRTVNENHLPGRLSLTEDTVETFVSWKNNSNVVSRIRFFESNESTYEAFGGYWIALAESYYENGDYEKCLSAIKEYENLKIGIFRKDHDYAEILPLAIVSAQSSLGVSEYVSAAEQYIEKIVSNTDVEQWALRYFAAQTYVDLYAKTNNDKYLKEAYNIALDNVNSMISKQRDMNETFLNEIVEAEVPDGISSEQEDEIENYNKMMKEKRDTELAPVYEPLVLNCDLLFSLAEQIGISADEKEQIQQIMYKNEEPLFLIEAIDNLYKFETAEIDETKIGIEFPGDELIVPVKYVSDNAQIKVSVKKDGTTKIIDDWTVDEVTREDTLDTFKAVYTSETASDYEYEDDMQIDIEISVKPDSEAQILKFQYVTELEEHWWIIPDEIIYQRR